MGRKSVDRTVRPRTATTTRAELVVAVLAVLTVAIAALPGDSSAAEGHPCDDVVVQFEPEGSGGATEIHARKVGCEKARHVVRNCIKGELDPADPPTAL